MAAYTEVHYPHVDDEEYFSDVLARLATHLSLGTPMFRGRVMPPGTPSEGRWEIETRIRGCPIETYTDNEIYWNKYPDWKTGLEMAMQNALARMCHMYRGEIPDSFRHFGRRNGVGQPVRTMGDRAGMTWCGIVFEDTECHIASLEKVLRREMSLRDQEKRRISLLENTILNMGKRIDELERNNDKLKDTVQDKEAMITALQAQSAYLVHQLPKPGKETEVPHVEEHEAPAIQAPLDAPAALEDPGVEETHDDEETYEPTDDEEIQDPADDDEDDVEEDPEPSIFYDTDGEEIVPDQVEAAEESGVKRRNPGDAREYKKKFKF